MDQEVKTKTWTTPIVERINLEFDKDMTGPCVGSSTEPGTSCPTAGCYNPDGPPPPAE